MNTPSFWFRSGLWLTFFFFACAGVTLIEYALGDSKYWWLAALLWLGLLSFSAASIQSRKFEQQIRALSIMVTAWRDSEFSISIQPSKQPFLAELTDELNQVGDLLRQERQSLVQREMLLQTVIQNSPMAVLVFDANEHIILSNLAARNFCADGQALNGRSISFFTEQLPQPLQESINNQGESICSFGPENNQESFHVSNTSLSLNGQTHHLLLIRTMTREMNRQEVAVWKKIIRVISHEINNSLAPIVSLSNTGQELLKQSKTDKLEQIFTIIGERSNHLNQFIAGYAGFAKLPKPSIQTLNMQDFFTNICTALECSFQLEHAQMTGHFDPIQVEQILINLVRNALEAGSEQENIQLKAYHSDDELCVEVQDNGQGMEEDVLAQALLPFYSTKRQGSGLGLALVREIMEAHQGRISLRPRESGGLVVSLYFPSHSPAHTSMSN